jgi:hypothetical protein
MAEAMRPHAILSVPLVLAAVASCQTAHLATVTNVAVGSIRVSAQVVRYEYKSVVGREMTFAYGKMAIENAGPVAETLKLDALRLSFDQGLSGGAVVDSVASIPPTVAVEPGAVARLDVYWAFDGRVPLSKLGEVRLLYGTLRN